MKGCRKLEAYRKRRCEWFWIEERKDEGDSNVIRTAVLISFFLVIFVSYCFIFLCIFACTGTCTLWVAYIISSAGDSIGFFSGQPRDKRIKRSSKTSQLVFALGPSRVCFLYPRQRIIYSTTIIVEQEQHHRSDYDCT